VLVEMTEKQWQSQVIELARMLGWERIYHTFNSRRSQSGFPDLFVVRDRAIAAELKRRGNRPTRDQVAWLNAFAAADFEVYLWFEDDLDEIATVLGKRWKFEKTIDGQRILRSELTSYMPQSLWVAGKGRADEARA